MVVCGWVCGLGGGEGGAASAHLPNVYCGSALLFPFSLPRMSYSAGPARPHQPTRCQLTAVRCAMFFESCNAPGCLSRRSIVSLCCLERYCRIQAMVHVRRHRCCSCPCASSFGDFFGGREGVFWAGGRASHLLLVSEAVGLADGEPRATLPMPADGRLVDVQFVAARTRTERRVLGFGTADSQGRRPVVGVRTPARRRRAPSRRHELGHAGCAGPCTSGHLEHVLLLPPGRRCARAGPLAGAAAELSSCRASSCRAAHQCPPSRSAIATARIDLKFRLLCHSCTYWLIWLTQ